MVIAWDASLLMGHALIDDDHRELIALINRLEAAVQDNGGDAVIGEILGALADYAGYHFMHEEQVMKATRYHDFENHRRLHTQLIETLTRLIYDYETAHRSVSLETLDFLRRWFASHVRSADVAFADYLKRLPASEKPDACASRPYTKLDRS